MTTSWYIRRRGQQYGPVPTDKLRELADAGRVQPTDWVRPQGETRWQLFQYVTLPNEGPTSSVGTGAPADAAAANRPESKAIQSTDQPRPGRRLNATLALTALALAVLVGVLTLGPRSRDAHAAPAAAAQPVKAGADHYDVDFKKDIVPLIDKYCYSCHGRGKKKGGLTLDQFKVEADLLSDRKTWHKVHHMLRRHEMPPEGDDQPTQATRDFLASWVDAALTRVDCGGPIIPGRVTVRRLNRSEYRATIADLVGVDYKPTEDFPADDVGYGFDNIGDVLSVSPLHLEKYLAAAEDILDQAITTADPAKQSAKRYRGDQLRANTGGGPSRGVYGLSSTGEAATTHTFPHDGEYLMRVQAFAQQAGPDPARMALRLDGRTITEVAVKAGRQKPGAYEAKFKVKAGKRRVGAAFTNDYYQPSAKDPKLRGDRNLYIVSLEIKGPLDRKPEPLPATHRRLFVAMPSKELPDEQAARRNLKAFATRAFRRPVADDELDRFMQLYKLARGQRDGFVASVRVAMQAVLVSPHFLFRVERDQPPTDPAHPEAGYALTDYELASRLSYFLWSSMPDDELFKLAGEGKLRDPDVLAAQAERMLKDARSRRFVEGFGGQWLQTRNLASAQPDPKRFKAFDDRLRRDMATETLMFFEAVMREDRSVLDLIDADFTFVSRRLAKHYGLKDLPDFKDDNQFQRVSLQGTGRAGVLTHASVLTLTSDPTRTSPVKRGKWLMEQILGEPPPPPPPDVPELEVPDEDSSLSLREALERHRTDPNCSICHKRMDAYGFAFEQFDAIGRFRTKRGKSDIDPSGKLPDGRSFADAADLRVILRQDKDLIARAFAEQLLTYAMGRGLEYYDKCAVRQITREAADNNYSFSSLVTAVVRSEPFGRRMGKDVFEEYRSDE